MSLVLQRLECPYLARSARDGEIYVLRVGNPWHIQERESCREPLRRLGFETVWFEWWVVGQLPHSIDCNYFVSLKYALKKPSSLRSTRCSRTTGTIVNE